jgi:TonB-dependent receptor-like protein
VSMTLNRVDGRTPQTSQPEFPSVNVTGFNGFSQSNIAWAHVNYNWHDVLSLLKGNHSIKVGTDIDRQHDLDNFSPSYVRPTFTFANVLDLAQDLPISQTGPILQTTNGQLAQNLYKRIHMLYVGAFLQDDWKIRPNFTLNLGLRYDYFGHLAQMDNGGIPTSFFTLGTGATFADQMANGSMRTTADGYVTAGAPWGVTPRIGFGWDVFGNGSFAVRGGYGVFLDRVGDLSYASNANGNPPVFGQVTADVRQGQRINYTLGSADGLYFPPPPGVVFTPNAAGGFANVPVRVSGVDEYPTAPRVQVWNLTLEKKLGNSIVIEADYLGNHANNLYLQTDVNRVAGDLLTHNGHLTRLTSNFGPVIYGRFQGIDDAHYGTFLINKRFSNGFSLEAMYTLGKATDYTSSNDNGTPNGESVYDAANFQGQHGRSDYSVARRFTFDSVYDVPSIWKSGWKSTVAGGWRLAAISIFQSGLPFSVITTAPYPTGDYNADGYGYDAPNTPAFGNHVSSSNGDFVNGLFLPSAFPRPAAGQQGNLGRNTFDGPGLANVNLNVIKSFKLPWLFREQSTLELRGEIFNLFNRTNLTSPVNNLSSPLFGKSVGQNLPRSVTFGARIQF